jgi:mRNA-degrading endonuclease toxin of MazEF toxin-antitoxin module
MEKTKELFELWIEEKQNIEKYSKIKRVKVWEIWLAKIWVNIWSEISKDGKFLRPVLVVKSNMWGDLVYVFPISTQYNDKYDKYLLKLIKYNKFWLDYESYILLNQFKSISVKRLVNRLNWFNRWNYKKRLVDKSIINEAITKMFE